MVKKTDDMLSRFYLIPERNGQTDGRTDGRTDRFAITISRVSKKRDVYAVRVTFHPGAVLNFLNPLLSKFGIVRVGPMNHVITHAQFQLNRFRG